MPSRVLALDLATCTGWALFVDGTLFECGSVRPPKHVSSRHYPLDVLELAERAMGLVVALIRQHQPDQIVIEDTNVGGRASRRSQKWLEWAHAALLLQLEADNFELFLGIRYLSSTEWRAAAGVTVSVTDRASNRALSALRRDLRRRVGRKPTPKELSDAKRAAGISGKRTIKHASVEWANKTHGLALTATQADVADAVGIGHAYLRLCAASQAS